MKKRNTILPLRRGKNPLTAKIKIFPKIFPVLGIQIRIRIHRIRMFLGLPDPDPLIRGMDSAPDPSLSS
jgi:hypothetical protein